MSLEMKSDCKLVEERTHNEELVSATLKNSGLSNENEAQNTHQDLVKEEDVHCNDQRRDAELQTNPKNNGKQRSTKDTTPLMVPPDGGWGWLVGIGTFINTMLLFSVAPCFGVLFSRFLLDLQTSSATTAWIFNVQLFIWHLMAPFVKPLCVEFGWRRVGFLGVALVSSSIIVSAFAPSAEFLFFSFSTFCGVGGGLTSTVCILILPTYFVKRRGAANTMLMSGICMGQILGAPLIRYLQDEYAFRGAALLYGGIIFNCSVGVALFHPLKWHLKRSEEPDPEDKNVGENLITSSNGAEKNAAEETTPMVLTEEMRIQVRVMRSSNISLDSKCSNNPSLLYASVAAIGEAVEEDDKKTIRSGLWTIIKRVCCTTIKDLRVFRSFRALIINVGIALGVNSYFNFVMMVPFKMQEAGFTLQDSAWCISVLGMCNLASRLIVSPLTDWSKFNLRICFMIGYGLMSLTMFVFPGLNSLTWMAVVTGVTGCGIAANITLNALIMIEYMGLENLPSVYGASCILLGCSFIVFGPFIGFIRDVTGSYNISIRIVGGMPLCSMILWFFMPAAVAYDAKREAEARRKEEHQTGT